MEITAHNVSYQYKTKYQTVEAVKEVTFTVKSGEFCAIIGKSGSGKTTLLSLLAGMDAPTDGQIFINSKDLRNMDLDGYRRKDMSLIFQNYNLFPLMTVQENVMYPLILNGMPKKEAAEKARDTLLSVHLGEDYLKRFPSMLSGGEQQRVAIARALANNTDLILADEPTGNLDEENTKEIVDLLMGLAHRDNRCVLVVTHDLQIARQADRVLTMNSGRITEGAL